MTKKTIPLGSRIFLVAIVTLCFAVAVVAGPPLICHSFEIGNAKSLRWVDLNVSGNYNTKNLAQDTLEILTPDTPVLVRMETLRRATLYARTDPAAANELLARLHARATSSETAGHPDALAWFDAGYLVETYNQWIGKNLPHMTDGMRMDANPAAGVDGYAMVKKAIALRNLALNGDDAQMEFAAALITLNGPQDEHRAHAEKAAAGSKSDALLAQNLAKHFMGQQNETVSELLVKNVAGTRP